ncbi:MAG: DUF1826 domain-containing protein [Candidatus Competibacteraceae bacterium]|jgi:hypothetical protein|nr:DUF1826 domain-containing protein [Candidatus Competibacteraceae bacterium]
MLTLANALPEETFTPDSTSILQPDCNLWLWQRTIKQNLSAYFDEIVRHHMLDLTLRLINPEQPMPILQDGLHEAGLCPNPRLALWVKDLAMLVRLFGRLQPNAVVIFRLETITTPGCRVFHVDNVGLRLLCTYWGPGTQWLDNANVNRDQLNLQGHTIEAANRAIMIDPKRIATLKPGWVAVSKGDAYPGNRGHGWVHRVYPQSANAPARLRLRLDYQRPMLSIPRY